MAAAAAARRLSSLRYPTARRYQKKRPRLWGGGACFDVSLSCRAQRRVKVPVQRVSMEFMAASLSMSGLGSR